MSKGNSGLFQGTLGSTYENSTSKEINYTERGIEVPRYIQDALIQLKESGDYTKSDIGGYSMKDVSIMSKETGVEFAKVSIGSETYLIRGNAKGTVIPEPLMKRLKSGNGTLDFHSHPHNDDLLPSLSDRKVMRALKRTTGQDYSTIVTPNGKTCIFNENGVIEIGTVSNKISDAHKKALLKLFGGK